MDFIEVIKMYRHGDFDRCINVFNEDAIPTIKPYLINCDVTKLVISKNNKTVCKAILQLSQPSFNWLEYMDYFIKLHSNYRSLSVIPLDLELNIVYNTLWWFCMKPADLEFKTSSFWSVLNVVSKSMVKVLKSCGETALGHELYADDVTGVLSVLRRASDLLLRLSPSACAQLLSVITMTAQMLLRAEAVEDAAIVDCQTLLRGVVDQSDTLRLHTQRTSPPGVEELFFRFGLSDVNSTASLDNAPAVLDTLVITYSLVSAVVGEYKQAIESVKQINIDGSPFHFLVNYLKAYSWLQLQQYSEAKLCLGYTKGTATALRHQCERRLLLARAVSGQGDHQGALTHCDQVLGVCGGRPRLASLAAHLASTLAHSLGRVTAQLSYLKDLIKYLRQCLAPGPSQCEGFEECCLTILSDQFHVSLPEAVYTYARHLYLAGYHIRAADSYSEVVELLKTEMTTTTELLPARAQVTQEAVLTHIRADRLTEGERLCRQVMREHVPRTRLVAGTDELESGVWEAVLAAWDEDVLSMILLADILQHSDKRKAMAELTRCYNAVCEIREQSQCRAGTVERELCDWLASRTLLRQARLSVAHDAVHYYRRALIHKPGDKLVVYHYRQWALRHPDHDSFDPGDTTVTFPTDRLTSLALGHVLGYSVSDEEWAAVCGSGDNDSQNIVDTLFDDDD